MLKNNAKDRMEKTGFMMGMLAVMLAGTGMADQKIADFSAGFPQGQIVAQNVTAEPGAEGLKVMVPPGQEGTVSVTPEAKYWDMTQWVYLTIEIQNTGDREARFDPYIQGDNPRAKGAKQFSNWHIGWVKPGETRTFNCVSFRDLPTAEDYPCYSRFPGMTGIPDGITLLNEDGIDASRVNRVKIVFPREDFARSLVIKSIRFTRPAAPELFARNPEKFFPFINQYGQYAHGMWPDKITDDKQFAQDIAKEAAYLKAHPGSAEWDRFGGYKNGPQLKATGHFRTEKIGEKWWIVDPDGRLFWSVGVNSAGVFEAKALFQGRKQFFESLPGEESPLGAFYRKGLFCFGQANLYRKYGKGYAESYVSVCLERMKSWGLNTLGGWSYDELSKRPEADRLPYTAIIHATEPSLAPDFPDAFDLRWQETVVQAIKAKAEMVKDDPFFFGFFVNNEIKWREPGRIAADTLSNAGTCAGKQAYVSLLKQRLATIEAFNQATGAAFKSWDDLLQTPVKQAIQLEPLAAINIEHYRTMCEIYFKVTADAIHQYAPGKMYLGCRWNGRNGNEYNVPIGAKYLDVLSFNIYKNEVERFDYPRVAAAVDKPFIVSEFTFGALDSGLFFPGLGWAADQRNRGEKYRHIVQGAMRNNKCVGVHWFMWSDCATAGKGNGANANCGLVSITDQIYYELADGIRETTHTMYRDRVKEVAVSPAKK